jgi:hypothetical protein
MTRQSLRRLEDRLRALETEQSDYEVQGLLATFGGR